MSSKVTYKQMRNIKEIKMIAYRPIWLYLGYCQEGRRVQQNYLKNNSIIFYNRTPCTMFTKSKRWIKGTGK